MIPLGCEQTTSNNDKVTVDELLADQAFQTFAKNIESFSIPILQKIGPMKHRQVVALTEQLNNKINLLEKKDVTSKSEDPEFEEIVKLMGYENANQYKKLVTDSRNAFKEFSKVYPEFEELADGEKKALFKEAMLSYYKKPETSSSKNMKASTKLSSCKDKEGLAECVDDADRFFKYGTGACVAAGVFGTFIAGAGCQLVNVALHEANKRDCIRDNCPKDDSK